MNPKQKKALGYTLAFGGTGLVAIFLLLRKPKPKTWVLHFAPVSQEYIDSVLNTLESHGTVHTMTVSGGEDKASLDVVWTPKSEDWANVPNDVYAEAIVSREEFKLA